MKILVINGSPKGESSITWQTVRYLQKLHPEHTFETLHVGHRIKALERDFTPALEAMKAADALLFSYPVYTFIAPCQLHRFVELMKEHNADVRGKWATQITTSKHFYDVTAHQWVQDNCADLGLKYVRGLSEDMDDLLKEQGRQEAEAFFQRFLWSMEKGLCERVLPHTPAQCKHADPLPSAPGKQGDVVIVTDMGEEDTRLKSMIARFRAALPYGTRVINLREFPFKGGCLGCFHCASDGTCIYQDGFSELQRESIQKAQAIVYAFTIRDHAMGARFKMYDDRRFCDGHRTVTMGMPMGYIVDGDYGAETNLQMILEARIQVGGNLMAGVACNDADVNASVDQLADSLAYLLEHPHAQPANFYGVGGMKIFRDLVYQMQGMMKADYKFYKAHGQMDFPQKDKKRILMMYLVGWMNSPKMRKKLGNKMSEGMLMPYKRLLGE